MILTGTLVAGCGGAGLFQRSHPETLDAYENILGWRPFPGSLNLNSNEPVPWDDLVQRQVVDGPQKPCFLVIAKARKPGGTWRTAALIRLYKSGQPVTKIELLAPGKLRDVLGLIDGDVVEVMVNG